MYHNNHELSNHTNHMQQCVVCVAGAGAAPQIGGKLAAEPWSSSALDASAAAAGPWVNHQVTLYLPIRAALARPCVAADTRASGRTLRACCPLGAPLGG